MKLGHKFIPRMLVRSDSGVDGNQLYSSGLCGHVINYNHNSSTGDIDYCNKPENEH
jgi:hypothetical protein